MFNHANRVARSRDWPGFGPLIIEIWSLFDFLCLNFDICGFAAPCAP